MLTIYDDCDSDDGDDDEEGDNMGNITKQVRMLAKLGFRSMSFLERTRIDARFPEIIHFQEQS